jgi:hypothetical protein
LIRQGILLFFGDVLLIQTFASINNMSKPMIEPWLLWDLWRWLGRSNIVITRERAFDLSPWWSD